MGKQIDTMEQVIELPIGTRIRSSEERHTADYWEILDRGIAHCFSAGDYVGPISEISLPATVLQEQSA